MSTRTILDPRRGVLPTSTETDYAFPASRMLSDWDTGLGLAGTHTPLMNGTAAVGGAVPYAREDHVHPTDTSRAPAADPAFSGNVTLSTVDAKLVHNSSIAIRDATSGNRALIRVMPNGTVSSIPAALQFFGTDYSADQTNFEALFIFSKGSGDAAYIIRTDRGGTGTVRTLTLTTGSNVGISIDVNGRIIVSLPTFANNAAAVVGGLSAGMLYRTGGDPDLVCVVHA